VSAEERTGATRRDPARLLAVEIADPPWFLRVQEIAPPARRGRLRDAIEWAIESALETTARRQRE
jgi:hypothetical protein